MAWLVGGSAGSGPDPSSASANEAGNAAEQVGGVSDGIAAFVARLADILTPPAEIVIPLLKNVSSFSVVTILSSFVASSVRTPIVSLLESEIPSIAMSPLPESPIVRPCSQ